MKYSGYQSLFVIYEKIMKKLDITELTSFNFFNDSAVTLTFYSITMVLFSL